MQPRPLLIPGVEFAVGDGVIVIPPLTLGALRSLRGDINQLASLGALDDQAINIVLRAALQALQRNYTRADGTDLALPDLENLFDVSQLGDLMSAVLDVSGLQRQAQAAKKARAQAEQGTAAPPTGTSSSLPSASTLDGLGTTSAPA